MKHIIQKGGIYLIQPFISHEKDITASRAATCNENLSEREALRGAYAELEICYNKLSEKLMPLLQKNKALRERVATQHAMIKSLVEKLNGKNT